MAPALQPDIRHARATPSTREAARRIGITETALRKAEEAGRITREPDGSWDVDKTRRRLVRTADPHRSPLATGTRAEGTPYARLKVAQLALKVEAQRLAPDENKRRLIDVAWAPATRRQPGTIGASQASAHHLVAVGV